MALSVPNSGYVASDLPSMTFDLDRGAQGLDSVTKSSVDKPVVYTVDDVCDNIAYIEGRMSINMNELIDCNPVQAASISVKVRIPYDGSTNQSVSNDYEALILRVGQALNAALQTQSAS